MKINFKPYSLVPLIICSCIFLRNEAEAVSSLPQTLSFDGQLTDASGNNVSLSGKIFKVEILAGVTNCILRKEFFSFSSSSDSGYFSLSIGSSSDHTVGMSLSNAINPSYSNSSESSCSSSVIGSQRKVKISVGTDYNGSFDDFDSFDIQSVAYSLMSAQAENALKSNSASTSDNALKLGGLLPGDFALVSSLSNYATISSLSSYATTSLLGSYVLKSGATMSGALVLNADPTSAMQASTKQYVDNAIAGVGGSPSWGAITGTPTTVAGYGITDAVTTSSLSSSLTSYATTASLSSYATTTSLNNYVLKSGDSMTGTLNISGSLKVASGSESCAVTSDGGLIRYSSGNIQFCNGSSWQTLGVAGVPAGLSSLNGQTGTVQILSVGTDGIAPAVISTSNTHTFNIPMASTASVTAGLISKTDYDNFNSKLGTGTSFSGDISGAYNSISVDKIKGKTISPATYFAGQVLKYDGTNWVNTSLSSSNISGLGSSATVNTGTSSGSIPLVGTSGITNNSLCTSDGSGGLICNTSTSSLLPSQTGNSGKYLTTDGTSATWSTVPSGTSSWTSAGNDAFYSGTGNVGIGTNTPSTSLEISKAGVATGIKITNTSSNVASDRAQVSLLNFTNGKGNYPAITFSNSNGTLAAKTALLANDVLGSIESYGQFDATASNMAGSKIRFIASGSWSGSNNPSAIQFITSSGNSNSEKMRIDSSGNVGIGLSSPGSLLHLYSSTDSYPEVRVQDTGVAAGLTMGLSNVANGLGVSEPAHTAYLNNANNAPLVFMTNNAVRATIDSSGNVGIGIAAPSSKLAVNGTVESKTGGFKFPDGTIQTTAAAAGGSMPTCPSGYTQVSSGRSAFCISNASSTGTKTGGTLITTCSDTIDPTFGHAHLCTLKEFALYAKLNSYTSTGVYSNGIVIGEVNSNGLFALSSSSGTLSSMTSLMLSNQATNMGYFCCFE